jgi:hypothetical protein
VAAAWVALAGEVAVRVVAAPPFAGALRRVSAALALGLAGAKGSLGSSVSCGSVGFQALVEWQVSQVSGNEAWRCTSAFALVDSAW